MKKCCRKDCQNPNKNSEGLLEESEFHSDKHRKDGLYIRCKPCEKLRSRGSKVKARLRNYHYKKSYGISTEEYEEMLEKQGRCCAICSRTEEQNSVKKRFVVDHNHITNKVRGILCHSCNVSLGVLRLDEEEQLKKLVNYLVK